MDQVTLEISGMSCGGCVSHVREALSALPGVQVNDVRIGTATVQMDPERVSIATLIDAVQDAGYEAREAA